MNLLKADNLIILVIITCCTVLVAMGELSADSFITVVSSIITYKFGFKIGIKKGKDESMKLIR